MAALCGLLLLWAGLGGLVNCNTTAGAGINNGPQPTDDSGLSHTSTVTAPVTASPSLTSLSSESPSQAPTPTQTQLATTLNAITADPQANSTQTSPPATTLTPTPEKPQPTCSYTIESSRFDFKFHMNASENGGTFTISLTENQDLIRPENQTHSSNYSEKTINALKPCTTYTHQVKFTNGNRTTICQSKSGTQTTTEQLNLTNILIDHCQPGHVCFESKWKIQSALQTNGRTTETLPCTNGQEALCIKLDEKDFCSNLNLTFTCGNTPVPLNQYIGVDLLNVAEILQPLPTKLPAEILPVLPPNCKNLTINYTCMAHKENVSIPLSDVKPFTDYTCTGKLKNKDLILNQTTPVNVRVDCDININLTKEPVPTAQSVSLQWNIDSTRCPRHILDRQKLSYNCRCLSKPSASDKCDDKAHTMSSDQNKEQECFIKDLLPFTTYTCEVNPFYQGNATETQIKQTWKTDIGKPNAVGKLTVSVPEHNTISATCGGTSCFYGREKKYIARLFKDSEKVREITNTSCNFHFKDLSYLTDYVLKVTASNGVSESVPAKKDVATLYNDKAVIGFLIFLILLTSVALLFVGYKIYILKHRKSHDLSENMMLISQAGDEESLLTVEPIAAEVLLEAYKRKVADDGRQFLAEFQSIPRIFSRYSVKEAKKACNAPKNRYVDILPYDHNRVQLTTGNGEAGCDYINASFIDGYKESKKYIAAQGPKEETVSDFWRMIWEQQSSIIVMVTRCEEGNRVKCAQYWPSPDRETEIYEEFVVKLNTEDHCPDYIIRHLSLANKREKNSEREVTHIQFMSWPDHGVPGDSHLLLKLRRRVNAFKNFFSGPIVVHCSAGVGRTGTYISIDAMMEGLEAEGRVDIYGYVVKQRRQRCLMVQVELQYILIHQALIEHNEYGETEIPLSELHSTLSTLRQSSSGSEPTLLEDEFERLPNYKTWRTSNTGVTEENMKKNRSSTVVPYDFNRVLLKLDEGRSQDSEQDDDDDEDSSDEEDEETTKYINASLINGYWGAHSFIAAQTPLPDTTADFWMMVYQKKASIIVMLSDSNEGEESDSTYWGKEKKTFGDFEVELTSTDTSPTFITRNMQIRHTKRKESLQVKQFHFLKWTSKEEKPGDLMDMIKHVKQAGGYDSGKPETIVPLVVHCSDGSTRSGVFCALWSLMDSGKTEKLVDVFQVAKTLRKERAAMIDDKEQYQFLYDALHYAFPVQNGEVKAASVSASDSVLIVNETKTAEEQPAGTTDQTQKGEEEQAEQEPEAGAKHKPEEAEEEPSEKAPAGGSNGSTVLEVDV
ncbi:receptor-type tyrosine-protein phosphatase C isoform X2 [Genypterus blacodes]|uniref:receptor-type tyrosine-protein phosphatase C isoform X2 n=1 Tax=Genypterus blacodes TaxID=154954 RepID=UPI003F75E4D4